MKIAVLQIEPLMPEIQSRLEASYTTHKLFEAKDPDALIMQVAPDVRAIVTGGGSGVSRAIFDALPKLEIIAINGVGTDAVDLDRARGRGVRVTNTPDVLTEDVADLGMALLLAALRQICVGDRFVRDGRWARNESLKLARKASRKKLGILGMGRIGRAIAEAGNCGGKSYSRRISDGGGASLRHQQWAIVHLAQGAAEGAARLDGWICACRGYRSRPLGSGVAWASAASG